MLKTDVSINIDLKITYPTNNPFHPNQPFPEITKLNFKEIDKQNDVYDLIRTTLEKMGLDHNRIGTPNWNPFCNLVKLGDQVLIKPNLVLHHNSESADIDAVVTHASVLRPIIDYVLIALKGTGTVIIGDAPHGDADFDAIVKSNGLLKLVNWYMKQGINIELRDFRKYIYPDGFSKSVCKKVDLDPDGYTLVNLKDKSWLCDLPHLNRLYGSDYDRRQIVDEHAFENHKYLISNTVLTSDVVISIPKLKTHKKTGITVNLKNLVGINGDKNYLAHYRIGSPRQGGDEYPNSKNLVLLILRAWNRFSRRILLAPNKQYLRDLFQILKIPFSILRRLYKQIWTEPIVEMGNWYGNDTCWRMCLDLNHILRFVDKDGQLHNVPQRRYFCVVDGIIAGEGNGPLNPDPKNCGAIITGNDPYQTDYVCAQLMGFKQTKIKLLSKSRSNNIIGFIPEELQISCLKSGKTIPYEDLSFNFKPHPGWTEIVDNKLKNTFMSKND